ncbi:hypothetical protein M9H77_28481 [Catharanthus roseus]|uniref:Uncharacterized protein n=1 Tax=Catharanthus roseus TaxID=4058 RepID=A0ACC0AI63_CATRO|nr:hypothetical protein M9H77_28481 [Catharanthus roseus]
MPMLKGEKTLKNEEVAEMEGQEKAKEWQLELGHQKGSSLSKKLLTLKNGYEREERLLQVTELIYLTWKGEVLKRYDDRNVNKLDAYGRLLHYMISNIVIPNVGHKSSITNIHSFVMLALHEHRRMNFGYMAIEHMLATQTSSTKCLPYGCFLARVFHQYFVLNLVGVGIPLVLEKLTTNIP